MNFLFDAAAQVPEVNLGIEQGMKLSELGRTTAMTRDQAAADNLEGQRRQADTAGLRLSPMGNMPGLPGNPDYFSQPASPGVTQVAAAAAPAVPAPAPVAPPNMIPAPAGGYGPIIPEAGLSGPVVGPSKGLTPTLSPLGRVGGTMGRTPVPPSPPRPEVIRTEDDYKRAMTGGTAYSAAGLNAGSPEAINNLVQYITEKNTGFATSKDRELGPKAVAEAAAAEAAKGAKATADKTPAEQALADMQTKAGVTPAAVPAAGKPADGQPLTAVASAGLATPGTASAAVAAEGATRFNMEIERAMNTRAVVAQSAKQQYDQNMFLANRAERDAQIARSVQNMAGYDAHMKNAITYRNQATAAHTAAVDQINKIDTAVQTNVLGFAVDRLTNLNDTTYISQVMSKQTGQTTAVRESGTLGVDGKPTYNMWIQGKSGAWTAVSDAKSGKPQPFSVNEIAVHALSASSEAYRAAQSSSNVEQAKAIAELGRDLSKIAGKSFAEAQAEIMKLEGSGEYVKSVNAETGDITYIPKYNPRGKVSITLKKVPDKKDGKQVGTVTTEIIP